MAGSSAPAAPQPDRRGRFPQRIREGLTEASLAIAGCAPSGMRLESGALGRRQHTGRLAIEELLRVQLDDPHDASATRDVMLREPLLEADARSARAKLAPLRRHQS